MPLVLKTLKTFFLAKTRYRYYRIHTSIPPPPDTPLRYACDSSGLRAAPPPRPSCQYPPPPSPADPPPPAPTAPLQVLTDSGGGGCRIRTSCSRPPGVGPQDVKGWRGPRKDVSCCRGMRRMAQVCVGTCRAAYKDRAALEGFGGAGCAGPERIR